MRVYHVEMTEDGLPMIVNGDGVEIGRALTKQDGEAIVEELNKSSSATLRDRVLSAVNDAVEGCFE